MPAQVQKASFAGTFGATGKAAAAKHAKDPAKPGGMRDLPGGIKNGVARLIEVYIAKFGKDTTQVQLDNSSAVGELYLRLVGSVESPKQFQDNGVMLNLEGRQFSQIIPLCRKGANIRGNACDFESCVAAAQNELKLIGGDDFNVEDVDKAVEALANAKPKLPFLFETNLVKSTKVNPKTKKLYEPRVFINWNGCKGLEGYNPETTSAVNEEPPPVDAPADDAPAFDETTTDLRALAEIADADPTAQDVEGTPEYDAAVKLSEVAEAAGLTEEDFKSCDGWVAILDLIQAKETGAVPDEPEPPKEWAKGDECVYVPPVKGPGGKLRAGKASVTCKVVNISKDKTKADIANKADAKQKWSGVPIDALTRSA